MTVAAASPSNKNSPEITSKHDHIERDQCEYTVNDEDILDVTTVAAASPANNSSPERTSKQSDDNYQNFSDGNEKNDECSSSTPELFGDHWHSHLLGCCSEPHLCIKTCFFPCGTLSRIATVATNKHMSSGQACNEVMAYSLILSCCCYTCCIRRKLRKRLDIIGGIVGDFLSHLMCCCCALVQEWREVEFRVEAEIRGDVKMGASCGILGIDKTKTIPPALQYMEA